MRCAACLSFNSFPLTDSSINVIRPRRLQPMLQGNSAVPQLVARVPGINVATKKTKAELLGGNICGRSEPKLALRLLAQQVDGL